MSAVAKKTGWGDVRWTGHYYHGFNGRRNAKGNLVLFGEVVAHEQYKSAAQVIAESLV